MSDTQLLGILIALGILVNIWCVVVVRQVFRVANETSLKGDVIIEAAMELLKRTKTA